MQQMLKTGQKALARNCIPLSFDSHHIQMTQLEPRGETCFRPVIVQQFAQMVGTERAQGALETSLAQTQYPFYSLSMEANGSIPKIHANGIIYVYSTRICGNKKT